jgi:hypothetical protein
LVPVGLDYNTVHSHDAAITLNYGGVGAGNWGSLALGGVGGANLRSRIANGYNGPISVGDWVTTEPGRKTGPFDQGFGDRVSAGLSAYPTDTYLSYDPHDPRAVILPVVDFSTAKGRSSVLVKAFAAVWIDSVAGGTAAAHFIAMTVAGGNQDASAPNYGAHGMPTLTR